MLFQHVGFMDFSMAADLYTEKAMAPHSSTLAWKIPQTEEPAWLQSMVSQRVGHDRSDMTEESSGL